MLTAFFHTKMFPPGSAHLKFYNNLMKTLLDEPQKNKRDAILEILNVIECNNFVEHGSGKRG
jgi:phosphatidate phosphatase APP1